MAQYDVYGVTIDDDGNLFMLADADGYDFMRKGGGQGYRIETDLKGIQRRCSEEMYMDALKMRFRYLIKKAFEGAK